MLNLSRRLGARARTGPLTQPPADRPMSQGRVVGVASAIWAASIFLSRVMGLMREQVVGRTLGASREADIYFASFTLPDFLNYLLAAGALSIVFIPIFLAHFQRGDEAGAWRAFSIVANFLAIAGLAGIVTLMIFAQPLASLVAPGLCAAFRPDRREGAI